jgi:hypothetical protein
LRDDFAFGIAQGQAWVSISLRVPFSPTISNSATFDSLETRLVQCFEGGVIFRGHQPID